MVGLIFFDQPGTLPGAQNRAGVLFFSLSLTGFTALSVTDTLALERGLVAREARWVGPRVRLALAETTAWLQGGMCGLWSSPGEIPSQDMMQPPALWCRISPLA